MSLFKPTLAQKANYRYRTLLNAEGGDSSSTQNYTMVTVQGTATPVLSNGGTTIECATASFQWGFHDTDTYDKDYTEGGKFLFEITVDDYAGGAFVAPGMFDPAQLVSSSYGGNHDGCGYLGTGTLSRVYHGALDSTYTNGTVIATAADVVITMAVNFDDDEVTYYIDGVTTGTMSLARSTPTSNFLRPVVKGYNSVTMSINPTILYPVDGFVAWG